ncbi:hypothetical protein ABPG74_013060 [Tetrahymena malaccensis]
MQDQYFSLPENKSLYILAKREKMTDKSFLEKAGDFLFKFTKTGFQIGSFLKGLGIGLAVNVVIGGIKAMANTQWQKETVFVCYCHESFNFEIISNHDKFTEQLKLDLKYLDQLQSKLNEFDQIIG